MRIDSHQHFWKAARGDYHWMGPAVPVLCRDYLPDDLRPSLAKHQIDKTILVQAAQTVPETDFLLNLAVQNNFIAGVIGWLDMDSPDFSKVLDEYIHKPEISRSPSHAAGFETRRLDTSSARPGVARASGPMRRAL